MARKTQIKAVEMVRRIRDEQAQRLAGKSDAEVLAFFEKAGKAARKRTGPKPTGPSPPQKRT